jgi:hypothetical protein
MSKEGSGNMKLTQTFIAILLAFASALCFAVTAPPPAGTVLPARLRTKLHPGMKPGARIEATIMQDVLLPHGGKIPVGSKVSGHVISVIPTEFTIGERRRDSGCDQFARHRCST